MAKRPPEPRSGSPIATSICPACAAPDPAVAFATRATTYLLCRACEHVWQTRQPPPEARDGEAWTSMAFRITRRKLARPAN